MDKIYERLYDDTENISQVEQSSEIQAFFDGQTIFLTGCTGFVGKVFVEKLLRSCSNINRLYILVRPKKQPSVNRVKRYFDDVIFKRLNEEKPNFQSRVLTIEGDLMKENLGLSEKDRATLVNETTLIYHNASNVKFDEKMIVAIKINIIGTSYMLDLAKECNKLLAFVYVSTAYSHCYKRHIVEKFYPPPADMKMISNILDMDVAHSYEMDEAAAKKIRGQWPNNYVFTKSMAEGLVEECAKVATFQCVVFRPTIVLSTYLEPIRGWCGNANGPVGAALGNGIGFLHAMYKSNAILDGVPADMCANALIASTWDAVVNKKVENEGLVYNYGSSVVNGISAKDFQEKSFLRGRDLPSIHMMGPYYIINTNCIWYYWLLHLTVHLLTALIGDAVLLCRGEKPQVVSYWILLTKNMGSLLYFSTGNWRIHVERLRTVWDRMNRSDSKLFFCDLRKLDWDEYCYAYWAGLRLYILKDPASTLTASIRKYKTFMLMKSLLSFVVQIVILYYVGRYLFSVITPCN